MKKVFFVLAALAATMSLSAQTAIRHIDTNGDKGACLFKEDANGFAEYKQIVPFRVSQEEALNNVANWVNGLGKSIQVEDLVREENIISFRAKVDINEDLSLFRVLVGDSARYYAKTESKLLFDCIIEVREGRLRFLATNIVSERDARTGDFIESEGPINDIHWNRVNGLKQRQAKSLNANAKSWDKFINQENKIYEIEHQVIADLAQSLKTSMMTFVEEEW